jgi:hypothetical protein
VNYFVACICVYPVVVILLAWGNALAGAVGALQKLLAPKQINVPSTNQNAQGWAGGPGSASDQLGAAKSSKTTNPGPPPIQLAG